MKVIATFSFFLLFAFSTASAAPFYQENFNFDSFAVPQNDALNQTGWKGLVSGLRVRKFGNLKVAPGIIRNEACYNSFPSGPEDGYPLWTKGITGLTVFTEEYSFGVSTLAKISYLQRLTGVASDLETLDGTKLALKIRTPENSEKWYISDDVVRQQKYGAWEEVVLEPQSMTFAIVVPDEGTGPSVPKNGNRGNTLPADGVVTGFGVFVDTVNGRIRLDNFALSDSLASNGIMPQPTPTRRPGVNPTVTNPDDEPDVTPTPEGTETVLPTPSATPTSGTGITNAGYKFCTASKRKVRKIRLSSSVKRIVLAKMKGRSARALRNRVIAELVLQRKVNPASLENIRVSDFYQQGKTWYVNVYGSERRPVRISRALAGRIKNYMKITGIASESQSPLLRVVAGRKAVTRAAVCQGALNKVVTRAIRKGRVTR